MFVLLLFNSQKLNLLRKLRKTSHTHEVNYYIIKSTLDTYLWTEQVGAMR